MKTFMKYTLAAVLGVALTLTGVYFLFGEKLGIKK